MATAALPASEVEADFAEPAEHYEVVDGRVVEEPPLGAHEIWIASKIIRGINFADPTGQLGNVVAEGLFVIARSPRLRRRPDVAFVSGERWPVRRPVPRENAWGVIPDLAVEITSPTDHVDDLMDKLEEYFRAGVRLVWVVYPKHRKVYAYDSPKSARILEVGAGLDGGAVLPGFRLALAELFETTEDGPTT